MIGFLMLMGIVAKNSPRLVDFAIEGLHRGTTVAMIASAPAAAPSHPCPAT